MIGIVGFARGWSAGFRVGAVALGATQGFEVRDRNETAGVGQSGIASFVPIGVVFSANDVEKVTAGKTEFLAGACFVVVEGSNNLETLNFSESPASVRAYGPRQPRQHKVGTKRDRLGSWDPDSCAATHTFLGGTMASADLGAMLMCGFASFSPLMDRRRAWKTRIVSVGLFLPYIMIITVQYAVGAGGMLSAMSRGSARRHFLPNAGIGEAGTVLHGEEGGKGQGGEGGLGSSIAAC